MLKNESYLFSINESNWQFHSNSTGFEKAGVSVGIDGQDYDCLKYAVNEKEYENEEDIHGIYRKVYVECMINEVNIRCDIYYKIYIGTSLALVYACISNIGEDTRTLGKFRFLGSNGSKAGTGTQFSNSKILCQSGWCQENHIFETTPTGGTCLSKTLGLLYNAESSSTINCSFLTFDRANTEIVFTWDMDDIKVDAYCDFDGYELSPGQSINSETFYLEVSADPFSSLEDWAARVSMQYKPDFQKDPSIGWLAGWTWRDFLEQETYEEIVLGNLDAIEERLGGFGVKNVWMSIGNLKDLMPSKWLEENRELFPQGWAYTIEKIYDHGLRPGFWIAPFWIPDKLCNNIDNHKGNVLKMSGKNVKHDIRWGFGESLNLPVEERVGFYCLDGSHPHTKEFLKDIFTNYYNMGIRYYMIDFLYSGSGSTPGAVIYDGYHDMTKIKGPEVYRETLKAIREAAGEDTYILASTGPTFQNIGCVDAVRSGPDFGEGRPLLKRFGEYPGTYKIENLNMLKHTVINFATTYFAGRKLYHNDLFNVITVDKPIPLNEALISASMLALSGGPVMLGDDISAISEERLSIVKKCIPPYGGTAKPVDLFTSSEPVYHCTFILEVNKGWDKWSIAGILNLEEQARTKSIHFKELGLTETDRYMVYDFWNERYLGIYTGSLKVEIPSSGIKLYRICKARTHPWLLSTDMHVTQGGVEIEHLVWDEKLSILQGSCIRPKNEEGNLLVHLPAGWSPLDYKGLHVVRKNGTHECILLKPLHFVTEKVEWSIAFTYEEPEHDKPFLFQGDERENVQKKS